MTSVLATEFDVVENVLLEHAVATAFELPEGWEQQYETKSNFILQSLSVADLGGPENSAFCLSYDSEDIGKDEVLLVGSGNCDGDAPLGLTVRLWGKELNDELVYMILQNLRRKLMLKGIMVKGSDNELWIRVSRSAKEGGFNLELLGHVLLKRLHEEFPEIHAARIILVTEPGLAFECAKAYGKKLTAEMEALKARVWDARGFNFQDCHVLGHCGKCADKKLCANIRKMDRTIEIKRKEEHAAE